MESIPRLYELISDKFGLSERVTHLRRLPPRASLHAGETGQPLDVETEIATASTNVGIYEREIGERQSVLRRRYNWQRRTFIGGIVLLMLSRAAPTLGVIARGIGDFLGRGS